MIMIMTMMIPRWRQHRWRLDNVDVAPVPHCFANPLMAQLLGFHSPCPMLHATFAIPHLRSLSTLLMRCDKLCHWTALALVFSWFSRVKLEMKITLPNAEIPSDDDVRVMPLNNIYLMQFSKLYICLVHFDLAAGKQMRN